MSADAATRRQALVAFLLYLAFVVYGSLVPFEYRALAWDQASSREAVLASAPAASRP